MLVEAQLEARLDEDKPNDLPRLGGGNAGRQPSLFETGEKRRSDGRIHDTGLVHPYRQCPADFRERYIELGQGKEIEEHYRTNWRVIRRWIEESGGDRLRGERYKLSGGFARPAKRSKRYVLGRTLAPRRR